MLDKAVLEVMVRSVALAAFVETPRDAAVVPAAKPRPDETAPDETRVSLSQRLSAGLKALGVNLAKSVARLRGASAKQPTPNDCVPA